MSEPTALRCFLVGYGTVGQALHRVIDERHDDILERYDLDLSVTGIARRDRIAVDDGLEPGSPNALPWRSGSVIDLVRDGDADVLVEMSPTNLDTGQPGLGHVRAAIDNGLHVVLANKGPVVTAYPELRQRAEKAAVELRFEATVAGAVPTLNAARYAFAGDRVRRVEGILNGTTNFILTRMAEEGSDLDQALKEAQALGYAETDPTNDIEGHDAAAKVVILANAVLGLELTLNDVEVTGITGITRQAVEVARDHGYRIKLVAEAGEDGTARVGPRLVRRGSSLDVGGALNAVRFHADLAGRITHMGPGAGGRATAAALLSDIVDVGRVTRAP